MQPDVSIVLPFYNEEECVAAVIEKVHTAFLGGDYSFEILAVQNGSRDRTGEILETLRSRYRELRVVTVDVNRGFGYGVLQGLAAASGMAVGWMPGDGQIPPEAVPRLLRTMNRTRSDMGQACRTLRDDAPNRVFISRAFNRLVHALFGLQTDDVNGEPKLLTRRAYNSMKLRSHDGFIDAEALLKAHRMGVEICRIEVQSLPRIGGKSKVRLSMCVAFFFNLLRARFQNGDPWGLNATPRDILSPVALRRSATR